VVGVPWVDDGVAVVGVDEADGGGWLLRLEEPQPVRASAAATMSAFRILGNRGRCCVLVTRGT
jgi:hypothetical protein